MNFTVIAAANNEALLESCLLNSPGLRAADATIVQRGFKSAASAYNDGISKAATDILVFAHQDVYFPEGWNTLLQHAVETLGRTDPDWGVAGVWGIKRSGEEAGYVYCAGQGRVLGAKSSAPVEIRTLDEVVLILRKSSGLKFDERLAGFHMYGTDICLEAESRGLRCYVISALCIHNTNGYGMLPWAFWRAYLEMRRKWKRALPIATPCVRITKWCWPAIRWNLGQARAVFVRQHRPRKRVLDPTELCRQLGLGSKSNDDVSPCAIRTSP